MGYRNSNSTWNHLKLSNFDSPYTNIFKNNTICYIVFKKKFRLSYRMIWKYCLRVLYLEFSELEQTAHNLWWIKSSRVRVWRVTLQYGRRWTIPQCVVWRWHSIRQPNIHVEQTAQATGTRDASDTDHFLRNFVHYRKQYYIIAHTLGPLTAPHTVGTYYRSRCTIFTHTYTRAVHEHCINSYKL